MSLASLADAPLLSKSSPSTLPSPNTGWKTIKKSSLTEKSNDQAEIDALFQEEGILGDKSFSKENRISSFRDQPNSARILDTKSSILSADIHTGHNISLSPFKAQSVESANTLGPSNQKVTSFSKIKDPNDVLAGFLAENSSEIDINEGGHLEVKSTQRDEFKSKWSSHSSDNLEPASLRDDDLHSTNSTKDVHDPMVSKKDEMDDILSLLGKSNNGGDNSECRPSTASNSSDMPHDDSEFGEYQPSCLSTAKPIHMPQKRHLNNFFMSPEVSAQKKEKSVTFRKETTFLESSAENPSTQEDIYKCNTVKVQNSQECGFIEENISVPINSHLRSSLKEIFTKDAPGLDEECKQLKDENISLREEIMKIETENLRLQKDLFEKEHCNEEQIARQISREKQEAQQISDELTSQLLTLKQSLIMTEEKIEFIKNTHLQEVTLLKNLHEQELEAKDRQLQSQMALLEEKHGAIETFSQLLLKADQWSSKIEELHKNMVSVKDPETIERPEWIANIESMVAEQESSLQMLGKKSTEVCNQLEKVILMLENSKKDTDCLRNKNEVQLLEQCDQRQELQGTSEEAHEGKATSHVNVNQIDNTYCDERQAMLEKFLEEKRNLEVERKAILHMKEKISNVDASLRKELLEHGLRMQMEAEDMARQKQELEHAKNIAAEIALEVESSRRELETCKTAFDKILPEAHRISSHGEVLSPNAHLLDYEVEGISRWERFRGECCTVSSRVDPISGLGVSRLKAIQQGHMPYVEREQDTFYIKAQEQFLFEAERALEDMLYNPLI